MKRHLGALLLSGAIGILATGCASSTPTFRAQSPAALASFGGGHGDDCPMCQMNGQVQYSPQGGQGQYCPPSGQCQDPHCVNLPCHPIHRNFHTYSAPTDLMYPPENQGAAVYQNPYYTLRGPTDFFMK
jgi:hypothetical protein